LEEAEEKYQNREPRDEDLAMIDQLKGVIHRLEATVKQFAVSSISVLYSFVIMTDHFIICTDVTAP